MLTETKNDRHHYFKDDIGRYQGEYKSWYTNGNICRHCFYVDGLWHGECKSLNTDGTLISHCFYVDDELYRDILENPVTDEDKFMITLETGGGWLC